MKKLAVLLVLGFLMVGVNAVAQEYELELIVFEMSVETVDIGGEAVLATLIWNNAPYGSGIYLSGIGYLTIDTPWGMTITKVHPINNVTAATTRRRNFLMPVSSYARPGIYTLTGWVEMEGVVIGPVLTDSVEVVAPE